MCQGSLGRSYHCIPSSRSQELGLRCTPRTSQCGWSRHSIGTETPKEDCIEGEIFVVSHLVCIKTKKHNTGILFFLAVLQDMQNLISVLLQSHLKNAICNLNAEIKQDEWKTVVRNILGEAHSAMHSNTIPANPCLGCWIYEFFSAWDWICRAFCKYTQSCFLGGTTSNALQLRVEKCNLHVQNWRLLLCGLEVHSWGHIYFQSDYLFSASLPFQYPGQFSPHSISMLFQQGRSLEWPYMESVVLIHLLIDTFSPASWRE